MPSSDLRTGSMGRTARRSLTGMTSMLATGFAILVTGCRGLAPTLTVPNYTAFGSPRLVTIIGYSAEVMEPFLSRDGRYLSFNNSNEPAHETDLHYAERVDDVTFTYRGPIIGANSAALDAVASVDGDGTLYFVSTRSYDQTRSTIYSGRFAPGIPVVPQLVAGISREQAGWVNFDAEISADGRTLYFADGEFDGGPVPTSADLAVAVRGAGGFQRAASDQTFSKVNTDALEYAAAVSADGLELFFTRLTPGSVPAIYRAVRGSVTAPFDSVARVAAITAFAEAATFAPDGRAIYFHMRVGGRNQLFRVERP